jgi:plastocyanin
MTTLLIDIVLDAGALLRLRGRRNGLGHPHLTLRAVITKSPAPVLLCILLLVACGGPSAAAGSQVIVEMNDYTVAANVPSVKAGTIKIGVRNLATMEHNFEVIKTDIAADQLPVDPASAKAITVGKVGEIAKIPGGTSAAVTLDLAPGKYVFICNLAGHYQLGMHTAFIVEP